MCDIIIMPDGREIISITDNGDCLCNSTQKEIFSWIVKNMPEIQISEAIKIEHNPFGYIVTIPPADVKNEHGCKSNAKKPLPDYVLNAKVQIGLIQQGHLATVEKMLDENKTWEEIGRAIGWEPNTVKEHYEWIKNNPET